MNECDTNPCQHPDATCQDKFGDYACYCPPKHAGKNCEIYDKNAIGGLGRVMKSKEDFNKFYEAVSLENFIEMLYVIYDLTSVLPSEIIDGVSHSICCM